MRRRQGFAILESLLALTIGSLVAAGLVTLLRSQARAAGREARAADLAQSLRIGAHEIARRVRSAGRGGLAGAAVEVRDNVPPGTRVAGAASTAVVAGTDVLTLRAVFEGPVTEISTIEVDDAGGARAWLDRVTSGGAPQRLDALAERAADDVGGAVLLAAPAGTDGCAVVELVGHEMVGEAERLALDLRASGSELADGYAALCDPSLTLASATRLGLLEEHRYYVRRDPDPARLVASHRLTRLRLRPGTERAVPGSPSAGEDLLDHAVDLQVALGIDQDGDRAVDDWLRSEPDGEVGGDVGRGLEPALVRFTLVLRAARTEPGWRDPPLVAIENHRYGEAADDGLARPFERRWLEVTLRRRR